MKITEARGKIEKVSKKLAELQVRALYIFGSVARNEATEKSDIDILVEFEPNARIGLFAFVELKQFLENVLNLKVDLVTEEALHPMMKDSILAERTRVA